MSNCKYPTEAQAIQGLIAAVSAYNAAAEKVHTAIPMLQNPEVHIPRIAELTAVQVSIKQARAHLRGLSSATSQAYAALALFLEISTRSLDN